MGNRLRIAWFSALPRSIAGPQSRIYEGSSCAHTTEHLLPILAQEHEIELFHDQHEVKSDIPNCHYLCAVRRHRSNPFDLFVYLLEDHHSSRFARIHAGLIPGVVWFHDFLFYDRGPDSFVHSSWRGVSHKFRQPESPWPARVEKKPRLLNEGFHEGSRAVATLFATESHLNVWREGASDEFFKSTPSFLLPVPIVPLALKRRLRRAELTVGLCGAPSLEGRAAKVLSALSQSEFQAKCIWLVGAAEETRAREMVMQYAPRVAVEFIEPRGINRWREVLSRVDVAVHTHFSVFGGVSPYVAQSMSAGIPTVVSAFGDSDLFPDALVFKVSPGEHEAFQLREIFRSLAYGRVKVDQPTLSKFCAEHFDVQVVGDELRSVLLTLRSRSRECLTEWENFCLAARTEVVSNLRSGVHTQNGEISETGVDRDALQSRNRLWSHICEPVFRELGWS